MLNGAFRQRRQRPLERQPMPDQDGARDRDAFLARTEFETQAVHVGSAPDPVTGAVIPPLCQSSTFAQEQVGRHKGYEYARTGNPTRASLEACLAALEGIAAGGPGGAQ